MRVFTFDTTLRDGTQGEAVSLSADDKVLVAHKLDELGIDYIEGGWKRGSVLAQSIDGRPSARHCRAVRCAGRGCCVRPAHA